MGTLTLHSIKRKASTLFEDKFLKTGTVLEVRAWDPSTIVEVDLHLPEITMDNWSEVPYIKFKVADFTYRDYTPSGWDAETHTCTIFVDAAHQGAGSRWAQQLSRGDKVSYLKVDTTRQRPTETSAVVALGDESSIGHMLALQQLTVPVTRFTGALVMGNTQQCEQFNEYFRSPLQPLERQDVHGHHTLAEWLQQQSSQLQHAIFYLAGNTTMVSQLRKLLRKYGYGNNQIKAQGFWS